MGIETKYDYTYYTVININELSPMTREEWFNDGIVDLDEAINYVEHLFKTSEDKSVNNYRVEYAGYEQDIGAGLVPMKDIRSVLYSFNFMITNQLKLLEKVHCL